MTTIYEANGNADATADRPADQDLINSQAQQHLDTQFFRKELLHLQNLLVQQTQSQAQLAQRTAELEAALIQETQRAQVAEQLRADLVALKLGHEALQGQLNGALAEQRVLAQARDTLQSRQGELQAQYEVLQQRHRALTGKLAMPLRVLPAAWRERLIQLGRRWLI